ncbi:MAG: ribonuclease HII [Chlamydiia bacterium]|nr:ribonuclease HII [Chlamydiia bacterium]
MGKELPSLRLEEKLRGEGFPNIAGIDEAGRGPLAGPVVASACMLPKGLYFDGVNDSKKLTEAKREALFEEITQHPEVVYGVGVISSDEIDRVNILQATILAMLDAVRALDPKPDYLLVDGLKLNYPGIPSDKIIKGDQISHSIAAASIIAKVTRDRLMQTFHEQYPEYDFLRHKGYGTKSHREAIKNYGICPIHRKTFGGCRL